MKKVLILAYDYPPFISVGGLRPFAWFNHLKEFGWFPVLVTRQWSAIEGTPKSYVSPGISEKNIVEECPKGIIIRTPFKPNLANRILIKYGERRFSFVRKAISAWFEFLQYVFPVGPRSGLFKEACKIFKKEKIDIIIATGDPFVLFRYASQLGNKYNIPWIADYRDPWTEDIPLQKKKLLKFWSKYQESKTLKSAAAVTTVSEFVKTKTVKIIGEKKFFIVTNGYDQELIEKTEKTSPPIDYLSIGFAGTIYNWNPIWVFLRSVNELIQKHPEIEIKISFFGTNINEEILQAINSNYLAMKEVVNVFPKMPQAEILKNLSRQHLLLLFNYYSFMGTKIFEYLGLKRKILFCFSHDQEALLLKQKFYRIEEKGNSGIDLQEKLILSANGGVVVKDANELKIVLMQHHKELKTKGSIACDSHGIEKYSRKNQVAEMAKIFDEVLIDASNQA